MKSGFRRSALFAIIFVALHFCRHQVCQGFGNSPIASFNARTRTRRSQLRLASANEGLERRDVLSLVALSPLVALPQVGSADDAQDLASQLFNTDGSLKEGVKDQATSRTIETTWPVSQDRIVNIDGINAPGVPSSDQKVRLSYQLPEKWESGDQLYLDRSEGVNRKACNRIVVYQAPGTFSVDRLEKATTTGVAKALDVTDDLEALQQGDLIGGRKYNKGGQTYFEFDMAVAPDTCGESQKNLGLGFCPYDTVVLLSSTIVEERLYVLAIVADDIQWKQENSDIKRVRSSFKVDVL